MDVTAHSRRRLVAPPEGLVVAGADRALSGAVQRHLEKALGRAGELVPLNALSAVLSPLHALSVVLVASQQSDLGTIAALLQEIGLQKLPVCVALVTAEPLGGEPALANLTAHVSGHYVWPGDVRGLLAWVRQNMAPTPAPASSMDPLQAEVAARLLRCTPSLAPLVETLAIAAAHPVTVLVDGETGTGKTYLARLLHDCSPRRQERFVVVPCGALAPNLVESEFFGHVKGAFTGADAPKVGKFAVAGEGTLLLDEIDALGLEQQASLLRVIETGEFEPVGSTETQLCRARVIAATNRDLNEAVERGQFRRDLFYRLNVMPFYLPPLRDRVEDIAPLLRGMAARYNAKYQKGLYRISTDVIAVLEAYPWQGNIRQLENVVQQAVLHSSGPELQVAHLPPLVQNYFLQRFDPPGVNPLSLVRRREESERAAVERALEESGFSRTRAARALGVSRVTLYKKMKKFGLLRKPSQAEWGSDDTPGPQAAIA
jgi:DNA-binding NtrC family response regulator